MLVWAAVIQLWRGFTALMTASHFRRPPYPRNRATRPIDARILLKPALSTTKHRLTAKLVVIVTTRTATLGTPYSRIDDLRRMHPAGKSTTLIPTNTSTIWAHGLVRRLGVVCCLLCHLLVVIVMLLAADRLLGRRGSSWRDVVMVVLMRGCLLGGRRLAWGAHC